MHCTALYCLSVCMIQCTSNFSPDGPIPDQTQPGCLMLLVMASPGGSSKGACCGLASAAGPPPTVWETQPPFSAETKSMGPSAASAAPRHALRCLGIVILGVSQVGVYWSTHAHPTSGHVMGKTWTTYDNPLELVVSDLQTNPLGYPKIQDVVGHPVQQQTLFGSCCGHS